MRYFKIKLCALAAVLLSGPAVADVERVLAIKAKDPAGVVATIDKYRASGEGELQSVNLLTHVFDGEDPATHTIVVIYDDMAAMDATSQTQARSAEWAATVRSFSSVAEMTSSTLALQRETWGQNGWNEGDHLAAVLVNTADPAGWRAALDEMFNSSKIKQPGMIRIVRLMAGAPASHAVLITAPSLAGLVDYMDEMGASAEFAEMRASTDSRPMGTTIYHVSKVWK